MVYIYLGTPIIPNHKFLHDKKSRFSWADIHAKVIQASDAHVIKLVYTCYLEDQVYHHPLYKYIALKTIVEDKP